MRYKNIADRFFGLVTKHTCDRWTDRLNYDSQDHTSIAASRGNKWINGALCPGARTGPLHWFSDASGSRHWVERLTTEINIMYSSDALTRRTITLEGFRSKLALLISCFVCAWPGGGVSDPAAGSFSCTANYQHSCEIRSIRPSLLPITTAQHYVFSNLRQRWTHLTTRAPHHSIFYRPDALPDAKSTVTKALKAKFSTTQLHLYSLTL